VKRLLSILVLILSASLPLAAQTTPELEPPKGPTKQRIPHPSTLPIEDTVGLPRVLIIGDSISMGYTLPVRAALKDKANVHRIPTNGGPTDRGVQYLDRWLNKEHWDVIYFNFGLHDFKWLDDKGRYVPPGSETGHQIAPLPVYKKNLLTLVEGLKKTGAKLIFATTTPVPDGAIGRLDSDRRLYNDAAVKIMKEQGVEVSDLAAFVEDIQSHVAPYPPLDPASKTKLIIHEGAIQLPYDVHFTDAGYEMMAKKIIAPAIEKDLPTKAN